MDFGTGGLDLAYEVMRGYDALVLLDASRQGGEPGTLYVIEPDEDEFAAGIEDGEMIDPHGMDPQTVLRFVNARRRLARARSSSSRCEPAEVDEVGLGLTPPSRPPSSARSSSCSRRSPSCAPTPPTRS